MSPNFWYTYFSPDVLPLPNISRNFGHVDTDCACVRCLVFEDSQILNDKDPLLTRAAIVEDLRGLGVPISDSKFEKLCMAGLGPPVDCYWGKRPLTRRSKGRSWAVGRMKAGKETLPSEYPERSRKESAQPHG